MQDHYSACVSRVSNLTKQNSPKLPKPLDVEVKTLTNKFHRQKPGRRFRVQLRESAEILQ